MNTATQDAWPDNMLAVIPESKDKALGDAMSREPRPSDVSSKGRRAVWKQLSKKARRSCQGGALKLEDDHS
jgi:hypothetical protein